MSTEPGEMTLLLTYSGKIIVISPKLWSNNLNYQFSQVLNNFIRGFKNALKTFKKALKILEKPLKALEKPLKALEKPLKPFKKPSNNCEKR